MQQYRIGHVAKSLNISADTLRYYEKRGLVQPIARNAAGVRMYDDRDISRLRFVRRAQRMNFTLNEIGQLLRMREDPQHARDEVRSLTHQKLCQIEDNLTELTTLRNELQLLVNLCRQADNSCPILEELDENTETGE